MPEGDWRTEAAGARARLHTLESEMMRARDRIHTLEGSQTAIIRLVEHLDALTVDVRALTVRVDRLAERALARPSSGGVSAVAAWAAVAVAIVALIVSSMR